EAPKLPGDLLYDNVSEAEGTLPVALNGNTGQNSMFVLLFIFLSAVTWRHARRDDAYPQQIGRRT
ncbi:MAG: hypothetical protein ACTSYK_02275, partial [Alphaproteobacteria bacterium]